MTPAVRADLSLPLGVAVDAAGNLVICDGGNDLIRVIAEHTGTYYGQKMTAGDIYSVAGGGRNGSAGNGGSALAASVTDLRGVTASAAGNVLLAEQYASAVRLVAAHTGVYFGQQMTTGDIYQVAGNGKAGYSGDGGPGTEASLNGPCAVVTDAAGNAIIADTANNRVRVVANRSSTYYGRKMTAGDIYTIAGDGYPSSSGDGGPAAKATLYGPSGLLVDSTGNLVIAADTANNRVRVIAAHTGTYYGQARKAGHIYTIAGNGNFGFTGDGGPATAAPLNPTQLAALPGGILVADADSNRIREITG